MKLIVATDVAARGIDIKGGEPEFLVVPAKFLTGA